MSMSTEEIQRQQAITAETAALHLEFKTFKETGIKHNGTDTELLEKFKATGHEIFFEDGVAVTRFDSQTIPVSQALVRYSFDAPVGDFDRRTLPREGAVGRPSTLCKADMTTADKVAYVNLHGENAFAAIPTTHTPTAEIRTVADFARLSLSEKNKLVTADPRYVEKLLPGPGVRVPGQAFINHAALDKIARTRPGYKAR